MHWRSQFEIVEGATGPRFVDAERRVRESVVGRRLGEATCPNLHSLADAKLMIARPGVTMKPDTVTVLCAHCDAKVYLRVDITTRGRIRVRPYEDQARARRSHGAARVSFAALYRATYG